MATKKHVYIVIAILFVGILLTSGCLRQPIEETGPRGAFIGGTKGLTMSFAESQPPSEVPEASQFGISFEVTNTGEGEMTNGMIFLGGINPSSFGVDNSKPVPDLEPARKFGEDIIPGSPSFVTFDTATAPTYPGDTDITIIGKLCYDYTTKSQATVCIKESIAKQTVGGAELCKISGDKQVYNMGAPVQVETVTQFPTSTGMRFNIKFKKVGSGTVYTAGSDCSTVSAVELDKIQLTNIALINLDAATDTNVEFNEDCTTQPILMSGGTGFITCTADYTAPPGEFEDVLVLDLAYGYAESKQKKVKVLNIGL